MPLTIHKGKKTPAQKVEDGVVKAIAQNLANDLDEEVMQSFKPGMGKYNPAILKMSIPMNKEHLKSALYGTTVTVADPSKLKPGDTLTLGGKTYHVGQNVKINKIKFGKVDPVPHKPPLGQFAVMGVDVSTQTGVVVLAFDYGNQIWRIEHDKEIQLPPLPHSASVTKRMERCSQLQEGLAKLLEAYSPQIVTIEGYSYGSHHNAALMVEFGLAARLAILDWAKTKKLFGAVSKKPRLFEVSPSTLKKFVLGKGVGKKEQVMMQTFKRWGYEAQTNNLADAYVLARIAAACTGVGVTALDKPQHEVLKVVQAKNA